MRIRQNLDFDMARVDNAFFQEYLRFAESLAGFGDDAFIIAQQFFFIIAASDTAATATIGRLEHDRITNLLGKLARFLDIFKVALAPRHAWNAGFQHGIAGLDLVAHLADNLGRRTDKLDTTTGADLGQLRILGQESIAGMQGIAARGNGQVNYIMCIEIANNGIRPDVISFIGLFDMECMPVSIGIDCDGLDPHFGASTNNANSNFPSIGYKDFFYHAAGLLLDLKELALTPKGADYIMRPLWLHHRNRP